MKISKLNKFLCRIAGSDLSILEQCPHEVSRHARIGAVVLSTALLAAFSMFFAISTITRSALSGIVSGIIWGLIIFVLDSYMVATFRKRDNNFQEFKIALPRLILALILGCSISIPLELKVFESEIKEKVKKLALEEEIAQQQASIDLQKKDIQPYLTEKNALQSDYQATLNLLKPYSLKVSRLEVELADEIAGVGKTGKLSYGPVAKELANQLEQSKQAFAKQEKVLLPKIESVISRIRALDSLIASTPLRKVEPVSLYGLSVQLSGLKLLIDSNSYVFFAYWVFFLLLISIETAPIFVKLFSPRGSYDVIMAMKEYEIELQQEKLKSDLHQKINEELEASRSLHTAKRAALEPVLENLMYKTALAQGEVAEKGIEYWKQRQLQKVAANPRAFVASSDEYLPLVPEEN
jgi:hypothetical protein